MEYQEKGRRKRCMCFGGGGNTSLHVQHISLHMYTYHKNVLIFFK
jgi:hypothetical protein